MADFDRVRTNGGAALTTDTAPNTTQPRDDDVIQSPSGATIAVGTIMWIAAQGGTSIVVSVWGFSRGMSRWLLLQSGITVLADGIARTTQPVPQGIDVFVQATTVTGATKLAYGWVGNNTKNRPL